LTSCTICSTGAASLARIVNKRMRSRACCAALREGQRALQPQVGQQRPKPRQRGLGLPTGPAEHQQIIGVPHQRPIRATPRPVQPVQVDVAQHGRDDSSHAIGNFEFEVALPYKRGERPRRTI
jgi:hypothetical protein